MEVHSTPKSNDVDEGVVQVEKIMATHPEHARLPHDSEYNAGSAFVIDDFCPILEASVPLTDCGFTHADAVYDVVSVSRGSFFRLEDHQTRFAKACDTIRVTNPFGRDREAEILHELVARTGLRDAYVWWTVTRGRGPAGRSEMVNAASFKNRFFAFAVPFVWLADDEQRSRGVDLIVSRDYIRIPPRAVDPTAKNFHWLDMQMALFEAGDRGAEWAVLSDEDGFLAEAVGSNIFAIIDDVVVTPETGCLLGITRQTVFDLCDELGLSWSTRKIHADEFRAAQEAFMTTTAGTIMPVRRVDEVRIGGRGGIGPISAQLHDLYWEKRWSGWHGTPVHYSE